MPWYAYSIMSALCLVGLGLSIKWLTVKGFSPRQILVFLIGLAGLGFAGAALPRWPVVTASPELGGFILFASLAGLLTSIGHWADFEAIGRAPNPGYASAIQNTNLVPVTLFSVLLFQGALDAFRLAAMALVLVGILVLVLKPGSKASGQGKTWLPQAFIALAGYSGSTLAMKKLTLLGFQPPEICLGIYVINFIFFTAVSRRQMRGFFRDKARLRLFLPLVLVCAGFAVGVNLFNVQAISQTPNLGFHAAIKNSSVVLITLLAVPLFCSSLTGRKLTGILAALAGVVLLVV